MKDHKTGKQGDNTLACKELVNTYLSCAKNASLE